MDKIKNGFTGEIAGANSEKMRAAKGEFNELNQSKQSIISMEEEHQIDLSDALCTDAYQKLKRGI